MSTKAADVLLMMIVMANINQSLMDFKQVLEKEDKSFYKPMIRELLKAEEAFIRQMIGMGEATAIMSKSPNGPAFAESLKTFCLGRLEEIEKERIELGANPNAKS